MSQLSNSLVLSVFSGIDLLGRGFELEGFCVVRSPDLMWGGDVRDFHSVSGKFVGVIGGSPCQDFSRARRALPSGYGLEMLREYARVVLQSDPDWWLLENVPTVPDLVVSGYSVQRFDLNARECGLSQSRLRHFQFGSKDESQLVLERMDRVSVVESACLASRSGGRSFARYCQLQGLPSDFSLPALKESERYRAVGNGVPVPMARVVASAIRDRYLFLNVRVCICGCGRPVSGRAKSALPACRKRLERRRDSANVFCPELVTFS